MKRRTARLHQSPKEFKLGIENCQNLDQNNEKKSEFLSKNRRKTGLSEIQKDYKVGDFVSFLKLSQTDEICFLPMN